jgi:two-component system, sensor histidine kinase
LNNGSIEILLIEDNPGDARLIKEFLRETGKAFELDWVDSLSKGLKRLDGKDAILLDLTLPDSNGLDTFKKIHSEAPALPIIVLTGNDDETLSSKALQEGAQDYLVKGQVNGQILARSIRYAIERKRIDEALKSEIIKHKKLESELIIAKESAEEAVKAKADFLANMSHELRTPMNSIIGFTSLLLDDSLTPDQKEFLEGIRNGGEALLTLISDILDFTRIEKDKVELERQPLSLRHCIEESLDMVEVQAGQKGLLLGYCIDEDTPDTIIEDHGRLRQVLVNLLSNAVKFTDEGEISVSVSSEAIRGEMRQILFEVKDTGIGIPQDKMNRLFQPFDQLERSISHKRDGIGLGLAISRRLVELMQGVIWAESIPGQGSVFCFTIQAEAIPGKQLDSGRTVTDDAIQSSPEEKPLRILVAEDNPSNQKVLLTMLRRLGYRPEAVADGREVLQALEIRPYDLILMDVKMPEMDGLAATRMIRKLRPGNGPKIVAITAYGLRGDRERCLEAGMDDYISKPVKLNELAKVVGKYQAFQVDQ